jgi:nitrate reductase gamma subunit
MNILTFEIALGVIVVLALFGFFLRRVSQEQGSVEKLSREVDSMEREQRLKEAAALKELKKSGNP